MGWSDDAREREELEVELDAFDELDADDEDELYDEDAVLQRVERAFRGERARVRAAEDPDELRALRSAYLDLEAGGGLNLAGRVRVRDLVELIDDRLTDLEARRFVTRRGPWPA